MEFRILGPLEVADEGRVLQLGTGRQLALVGLLLLHANEVLSVDRIVDELWGESPPTTAAKIVRNSVSVLRRELGDRLVTRSPGYLLRVEPGELDSERLERAVERGDLASLNEALALWRGHPLAQLAYEPFAGTEIARLEDLRLSALEARIDAQLALGRHAALIGELEALVRQEPLRERLRGQLMLALYRSGRQAEALEVYRQGRRALDEQLGLEPGPELRDLERKILIQDESIAAPPAPAPAPFLRRRRAFMLLAAAFALGGAVALAAYLTTRGSVVGLKEIPPNYVGAIDAETNAIVAAVPVGVRPGPVAAGAGAIWVGNVGDRDLTKIDPQKRSPAATFSLGNRTPTGVAVGRGAVWVVHGIAGELSSIEPEFGRDAHTVRITTRPFGAPTGGVAVGAGAVWAVFGDSTLAHRARANPAGAQRGKPNGGRRRRGRCLGGERRRRDRRPLQPRDLRGGAGWDDQRRQAARCARLRGRCRVGGEQRRQRGHADRSGDGRTDQNPGRRAADGGCGRRWGCLGRELRRRNDLADRSLPEGGRQDAPHRELTGGRDGLARLGVGLGGDALAQAHRGQIGVRVEHNATHAL
jgi:DNA-binding SARP family transcriptional activator